MHRPFFIVFLVAVTYVYVTFAAPKNNQDYTLCTTQNCVDTASKIAARLDPTVDPCDNFYQFACGGWAKNNPANISYPRISSLSVISEETTEQIREILEDAPGPNDTLSLQKARKIYNMCMDTETLKKIGISGLSRIVRKNGGWPMTMSPFECILKGSKTWQEISNIMQRNLFDNGLYSIAVMVDDKKSDSNVITILEPTFFAPRDIVISLDEDLAQKMIYKSYIKTVANIFINDRGSYVDDETLSQNALDVVNFEIELAKLTLDLEDSRDIDKVYNALTIKQLQQAYDAQHPLNKGKINWLERIRRLFAPKKISSSEKVVVHAYKYLTNLVPLLERTPNPTIVNYMQWNLIRALLPYTERTEAIAVQLARHFKGERKDNLRWKNCVSKANLDSAISYEYAKRYVKHQNKEDLTDIITNIEDVVGSQISASTWMDETTKKASLEKLAYMRMQVLTPDWYSNKAIDKYYDGLTVRWEYLDSVINIFNFETKRMLGKLRKPVDKNEWLMEPTVVNAYYDPSGNEIVITAAISQDPVYDKNHPAYLNYGGVGVVIGHEINHGFDNLGRKYDKNGNAVQWWTQKTIDNYEQLAQCFVDQYNGYLVPGLEEKIHVNGQLTLGENIGDSAGVVAAYYAYRNKKTKLNKPEVRLQGLEEYSDDQIFFMSFAHAFCENATPQQIRVLLLDEHPRPEIRIRGSLSNFPEFSAAYSCPAGKGMNPDKKCTLW